MQLYISGIKHTIILLNLHMSVNIPSDCCHFSLDPRSPYPRVISSEGRREPAACVSNPQTSRECEEQL